MICRVTSRQLDDIFDEASRKLTPLLQDLTDLRGDANACESAYQDWSASMHGFFESAAAIQTVASDVAGSAIEEEDEDEELGHAADEDGPHSESLSFNLFDTAPRSHRAGKGSSKASAKSKANPKRAVKSPVPVSRRTNPMLLDTSAPGFDFNAKAEDAAPSSATGPVDPQPQVAPKLKLPKKQAEAIKKAEDLLGKANANFTSEVIWNNKLRRRLLDAAIKSLTQVQNQLLNFVDECEDAKILVDNINDFCDSATARFDALSTLRASPFFYLEPANLDDAMFEVFLAMSVPLLGNLVQHIGAEALKCIDQDCGCFAKLCAVSLYGSLCRQAFSQIEL